MAKIDAKSRVTGWRFSTSPSANAIAYLSLDFREQRDKQNNEFYSQCKFEILRIIFIQGYFQTT
jgi:hypothetical protein